jgi:hypothetical protein
MTTVLGVTLDCVDIERVAASWLVQDGVPLYDVQALLGHESFRTTERYANSRELHQPGEKLQVSRSAGHRIAGTAFRSSCCQPCDLGRPGGDPV